MVNKGGNGEEEEAKGMMRSAQLERGYSHHFLAGIVMVGARVLTTVANTMRRSGIMMGLGRLDVTTSQRDTQVLRVGHVRACTGERMIVCSGERERVREEHVEYGGDVWGWANWAVVAAAACRARRMRRPDGPCERGKGEGMGGRVGLAAGLRGKRGKGMR